MADNEFDAELEAIMGGPDVDPSQGSNTSTPAATPAPAPSVIEAGGRKFNTPQELAKSYDALVRDYTKKAQSLKQADPWVQFGTLLDKHPELRQTLSKSTEEYFARQKQGSQPGAAQSQKAPNEVYDKRIDEVQARLDDLAVEREIEGLRSKYNLDDATVDAICEESESLGGIPLEKAYRIVKSQELFASNQAKTQSQNAANKAKAANANVGNSNAPNVAVAPKSIGKLTSGEWRSEGARLLDELGYQG